ncbi:MULTISPECIES: nitroreductase [unclassified Roseovarius]|uniref:nitroreductase n=1 Tax=unclassified Roseovarius TaxID=2614913 RepID=UPI00273EFB92|nr:nitroreductase [Roseovarius sp. MMSF_3350]
MSADGEALKRLMQARYSCRAFRPEQVAEAVIERIVDTARHTASWNNTQPWGLLVTRGTETEAFRQALLSEVQTGKPGPDMDWPESYPGALGERRRTCGYALYNAVGIAREDREARARQSMRNFELFDAPHVAILHIPRVLGPYGALDAGGFLTAFMLAATAEGLGTIAQAAVAAYPQVIRRHFDLPEDQAILCAISFGYSDDTHPVNQYRTEREDVGTILSFKV